MRRYDGEPGWRRLTVRTGIATPIVIYNNREDSRLFVPKLHEVGTALNFAHPWARGLFGLMVALPLLAVVLFVLMVP